MNEEISSLNEKLDERLKKQEHDYLKGYSLYVKQKEKDLRQIITELNKKNEGNSEKDQTIYNLKQTIKKLTDESVRSEQEKKQLMEKTKYWKSRCEAFEMDKSFLQDQVLESKRKNKLLKLAINRMQVEIKDKDDVLKEINPTGTIVDQFGGDSKPLELG